MSPQDLSFYPRLGKKESKYFRAPTSLPSVPTRSITSPLHPSCGHRNGSTQPYLGDTSHVTGTNFSLCEALSFSFEDGDNILGDTIAPRPAHRVPLWSFLLERGWA